MTIAGQMVWRALEPDNVTETVSVTNVPNYEERRSVSYINFVSMRRFNEQVNLEPILTPVGYRDTVYCYINSSKRRFKSTTLYQPKVRPRKFSDTLIVFPKRPLKSYVTCLDYHIDECRRWFKTEMEFKAKTYTTSKIIKNSDGESVDRRNGTDSEYDELGSPDGYGVSQVFIPRWNKDGQEIGQIPHLVNGELILNGF